MGPYANGNNNFSIFLGTIGTGYHKLSITNTGNSGYNVYSAEILFEWNSTGLNNGSDPHLGVKLRSELVGSQFTEIQSIHAIKLGNDTAALYALYTTASGSGDQNIDISIDSTGASYPPHIIDDVETWIVPTSAQLAANTFKISSELYNNGSILSYKDNLIWHEGNLTKTSSATSTSSGHITKVGDYGWGVAAGVNSPALLSNFHAAPSSGTFALTGTTFNGPRGLTGERGTVLVQRSGNNESLLHIERDDDRISFKRRDNGVWQDWVELYSEARKPDINDLVTTETTTELNTGNLHRTGIFKAELGATASSSGYPINYAAVLAVKQTNDRGFQLAAGKGDASTELDGFFIRNYNGSDSNGLSPWSKVYTDVHPPTASEVGALPSSTTLASLGGVPSNQSSTIDGQLSADYFATTSSVAGQGLIITDSGFTPRNAANNNWAWDEGLAFDFSTRRWAFGADVEIEDNELRFGTNVARIYNANDDLYIRNDVDDVIIQGDAVVFRNLSGENTGYFQSDFFRLYDDKEMQIGSSADLRLWHDSSATNSYMINYTGDLLIRNLDSSAGNGDIFIESRIEGTTTTQSGILVGSTPTGVFVNLYGNDINRLKTTTTGVDVTGDLRVDNRDVVLDGQALRTSIQGSNHPWSFKEEADDSFKIGYYDGTWQNTLALTGTTLQIKDSGTTKTVYHTGNKPSASDVGALPDTTTLNTLGGVPTSRTINGQSLANSVTLSASDVGALTESSLETTQQRFTTAGTDIADSSSAQFACEVYNADSDNDAFMRFHIAGTHALHFGLDAERKRLMVGGYSEGVGNKRDIITRQTAYYSGLSTDVNVGYRPFGNDALIQLWSVNGGRLKIVDDGFWEKGDCITIVNNNPSGNLLIRNPDGLIYLPDGSSVAAGVDMTMSVAGTVRLVRYGNGANWMLSV